ncbi:hypothetical protein [Sphingobium indicum]|nr:hypothetical protein [Sphingobium indicum]
MNAEILALVTALSLGAASFALWRAHVHDRRCKGHHGRVKR